MRVSADTHDPDNWRLKMRECPAILLDGVKQEWVVSADDERGVVVLCRLGDDGKPVFDREIEHFLYDVRVGKVEIQGARR